MKWTMVINAIIAVTRSFLGNQAIAEAIKSAAVEALNHGEWSEGEKTAFVLAKAQDVVNATPTQYDDLLFPILANLYVRKYMGKGKLPAPPLNP